MTITCHSIIYCVLVHDVYMLFWCILACFVSNHPYKCDSHWSCVCGVAINTAIAFRIAKVKTSYSWRNVYCPHTCMRCKTYDSSTASKHSSLWTPRHKTDWLQSKTSCTLPWWAGCGGTAVVWQLCRYSIPVFLSARQLGLKNIGTTYRWPECATHYVHSSQKEMYAQKVFSFVTVCLLYLSVSNSWMFLGSLCCWSFLHYKSFFATHPWRAA